MGGGRWGARAPSCSSYFGNNKGAAHYTLGISHALSHPFYYKYNCAPSQNYPVAPLSITVKIDQCWGCLENIARIELLTNHSWTTVYARKCTLVHSIFWFYWKLQRWEFIKENKKIKKKENTLLIKKKRENDNGQENRKKKRLDQEKNKENKKKK